MFPTFFTIPQTKIHIFTSTVFISPDTCNGSKYATVIFSIWQKFQQPLFYICFQRPLFYNHMLKPVSVQILSTSFFSSSNKDSYIQYSPNYFYQDSYFFLNFFPILFNIHSLFFSLLITLGLANYFLMTQTTMR